MVRCYSALFCGWATLDAGFRQDSSKIYAEGRGIRAASIQQHSNKSLACVFPVARKSAVALFIDFFLPPDFSYMIRNLTPPVEIFYQRGHHRGTRIQHLEDSQFQIKFVFSKINQSPEILFFLSPEFLSEFRQPSGVPSPAPGEREEGIGHSPIGQETEKATHGGSSAGFRSARSGSDTAAVGGWDWRPT
ncbi:hypothetical protein IEQ34_017230 [Dendrobium chrysotoxum]|uniref:Uncharacterized protein n=1 Tax=Dendrobium chrysotoxum TaxID=161865 RepID=A0AAV7G907_DENCH|nr:hypothetical protein IEQ34_017230 [Dendrobium chrysotoxum]